MPVRDVPKNYRNVTGALSTSKCIGSPRFESLLEQDLMILLEFDKRVQSYEMQPVTITYLDPQKKLRSYTPDALIKYKDSCTLVEVKYRKDLKEIWAKEKPKYRAAVRFAKSQGWKFKILTDVEIRTSYLDNVKFLRKYRTERCADDRIDQVWRSLVQLRESTPQGLIEYIADYKWHKAEVLRLVWHMVADGSIQTDLTLPLTMNSAIWYRTDLQ